MTKTKAKPTRKTGEGVMPEGSDLTFWGADAVYADNPNSFALNDPRQVKARLDARKARLQKVKA